MLETSLTSITMERMDDYVTLFEFMDAAQISTPNERNVVIADIHRNLTRLSAPLPYYGSQAEKFAFDSGALRGAYREVEDYAAAIRAGRRAAHTGPLLGRIGPAVANALSERGELKRYWECTLEKATKKLEKLEEEVGNKRKYIENIRNRLEKRFTKKKADESDDSSVVPGSVPGVIQEQRQNGDAERRDG